MGNARLEDWRAFLRRCALVTSFSDDTYGPPLQLTRDSLAGVFRTQHIIFPHLSVLKVNVFNLRKPLISPAVEHLTVFIDHPEYGHSHTVAAQCLHRTARLMPNVVTLRVDAEEHVRRLGPSLSALCQSLPRLQTVVLAPSALSVPLFEGLSQVRSLVSIKMLECARTSSGGYVYEHGVDTKWSGSAPPSDCFPNLRELGLICSGPQALRNVFVGVGFGRSLVRLWIRFPDSSDLYPLDVREIIESLSKICLSLESLTLRFAQCRPMVFQGFTGFFPLCFVDIEPFLSFPRLKKFAIDHSLPLRLTESDLKELSFRACGFEQLWLNPYPPVRSVEDLDSLPGVHCLSYFARFCPSLRRLGVLVDGRDLLMTGEDHCQFLRLQELFVGWSPVTVFDEVESGSHWRSLAAFLFELMPFGSELSTVELQSEEEILSLASSDMRAMGGILWDHNVEIVTLSNAWRSVWAMVLFLRSTL